MPAVSPGPIVLPSDIENAVRDVLKTWVPFYLADIDEQQGRVRGTTRAPRFYYTASDSETRWLEETPPVVLVACPGTIGDPALHGDAASYGVWWQINIGVTAGGASEDGSRALASRIGGAITYTLAQQGDMNGLAEHTRWGGMRTDVAARDRKLTVCEVPGQLYISRAVDTRGLIPRSVPANPTDPADSTLNVTGTRIRVARRP